jgi:MFS family permease
MKASSNAAEMDPMIPLRDYKMPWIRALLASGMAAALGWGITTGALLLCMGSHFDDREWAWYLSRLVAVVVSLAWLTVLLPIYRRIPPEARIWKWPLSMVSGAVAGELVMIAILAWFNSETLLHHFSPFVFFLLLINPFAIWAISLGGSIGLIAGLTHTIFRKPCKIQH